MKILTGALVNEATMLAAPSITQAIFNNPQFVWGPKLLAVCVVGFGEQHGPYWIGDRSQEWHQNWGRTPDDFAEIALWKANKALETGMPTSMLIGSFPLLLRGGDYTYAGGIVDRSGKIGVGCSGIRGIGDEAVAKFVLAAMELLAAAEAADMVSRNVGKI